MILNTLTATLRKSENKKLLKNRIRDTCTRNTLHNRAKNKKKKEKKKKKKKERSP